MTETPKRRGRPPGAKNKAKPLTIEDVDAAFAKKASIKPATGSAEPDTFERSVPNGWGTEPAGIESWTAGSPGVKVVVRFRSALSTPGIEHEVDWPAGWPIPQLNDTIRLSKEDAGRVQFVEYDYGAGVIRISVT